MFIVLPSNQSPRELSRDYKARKVKTSDYICT